MTLMFFFEPMGTQAGDHVELYNLSYSSAPTSIFPLKLWNTVWDTESRITLFENLYLFNLLKGVNLHPFIFSGLEKIKRGKKTQK